MSLTTELLNRLVIALEKIPGSDSFNTRTHFLEDIGLSVQRDASNRKIDLKNMVSGLRHADPKSLPTLIDNAIFVTGGGAFVQELQALKTEVVSALQASAPTAAPPTATTPVADASSGAWDNKSLRALREALTDLYTSPTRIRLVCSDVGIRTSKVNFSNPASEIWLTAIEEATEQKLLDALLAYAREEYPHSPRLNAFVRR